MRATTLKASPAALGGLIAYYAGLTENQARRYGVARGPIHYYLDPAEPPGRWWGRGCAALGLGDEVLAEELEARWSPTTPAPARLGREPGSAKSSPVHLRSRRAYGWRRIRAELIDAYGQTVNNS